MTHAIELEDVSFAPVDDTSMVDHELCERLTEILYGHSLRSMNVEIESVRRVVGREDSLLLLAWRWKEVIGVGEVSCSPTLTGSEAWIHHLAVDPLAGSGVEYSLLRELMGLAYTRWPDIQRLYRLVGFNLEGHRTYEAAGFILKMFDAGELFVLEHSR